MAEQDTVIRMERFVKANRFAAIRQVEAYWTALTETAAVPARADLDPRGLDDVLDFVFIAERTAPGKARMRIAGDHYCDLLGMEARGMMVSAMFLPPVRQTVEDLVDAVCDRPGCATIALEAERGMGRPVLDGVLMLFPLRSDLGDISRILGAIGTRGTIGRAPRNFTVTAAELAPIPGVGSGRTSYPTSGSRHLALGHGMAEPPADFEHRTEAGPVPWLRVVKNE